MSTMEELARCCMWNRLFNEAGIDLHQDRKYAKRDLREHWGYTSNSDFQPQEEDYKMARSMYSLTSVLTACPPVVIDGIEFHKKNKEPQMAYEYNQETDQRNYMKRRLDDVRNDKYDEINQTYHINYPELKDKAAVLAAIAAGNIEWNDYYFNSDGTAREGYAVGSNSFVIVDPLKDMKGRDAAAELLQKKYIEAKDKIIVMPLADGLAALQAFEAQTF